MYNISKDRFSIKVEKKISITSIKVEGKVFSVDLWRRSTPEVLPLRRVLSSPRRISSVSAEETIVMQMRLSQHSVWLRSPMEQPDSCSYHMEDHDPRDYLLPPSVFLPS